MKFATRTRATRRDAATGRSRARSAAARRTSRPACSTIDRSLRAGTVALLAAAFAAAPAARPATEVVRGEPRRFLVHFEDVVRNDGDAPLEDVVCDALLPLELPRQRVRWIRLSPHAWTIRKDAHGQTVATARAASIEPGGAITFAWIASVDLAAEDHAPVAAVGAPAPADASRYLDDDPRFGLASAAVQDAAAAARARAPEGATALALAEAAAAVVHERVRYELSGGWDPAPRVLERGTGSCSESVFAFVAICRRLGLPARWTGGTLLRGGPPSRACDATFHRVAEVWLPGHGWWPVETEAPPAAAARDAASHVPTHVASHAPRAQTALGRGFLLLARGDASADAPDAAPLGDAYHAVERWSPPRRGPAPRALPRVVKRAWWLAGADDQLAFRGADAGLPPDAHPSFARCELLACDARGYGPPLRADGTSFDGAAPAAARSAGDVARVLLAAGHPEGLRLAALSPDVDAESLIEHAAAACDADLAAEFLAAAGGTRARFEAWWSRVADRVAPDASRRLTLVPR